MLSFCCEELYTCFPLKGGRNVSRDTSYIQLMLWGFEVELDNLEKVVEIHSTVNCNIVDEFQQINKRVRIQ